MDGERIKHLYFYAKPIENEWGNKGKQEEKGDRGFSMKFFFEKLLCIKKECFIFAS